MSEEFISKKELLEATGLSYGQLYRWKRLRLIPEHWFIKRATFTGQETFFPKNLIIERIETIQRLKEERSLEELAELLSPTSSHRRYRREDVLRLKGLVAAGLELVAEVRRTAGAGRQPDAARAGSNDAAQAAGMFTFLEIVGAALAGSLAARGLPKAAVADAVAAFLTGADRFATLEDVRVVCLEVQGYDGPLSLVHASREPLVYGSGVALRAEVAVGPLAETVRLQLQEAYG